MPRTPCPDRPDARSRPAPSRRPARRRAGGDEAVANVLGDVLTAVSVGGLMLAIGATFLQQPPPEDATHVQLAMWLDCGGTTWGDGDETVVLEHRGGEALLRERTTILLRAGSGEQRALGADLGSGFDGDGMTLGDRWLATVTADLATPVQVRVTTANPDGTFGVPFSAVLTDRVCPGTLAPPPPGSPMAFSPPGGGPNGFEDPHCDGVYTEGQDIPIPDPEFMDGDYDTEDTNCLVILASAGPISAPSILFQSRGGGILVLAPMWSGSSLVLDAHGGLVRVPGVAVTAVGDLDIRGAAATVTLEGSNVTSERGQIRVNGQAILADGAQFWAGRGHAAAAPPPVSVPGQSGPGSIRLCVTVIDRDDRISTGQEFAGRTLTMAGRPAAPGHTAAGIIPPTPFTLPLELNADILFADGIADSQCATYDGLALGGWFYAEETLSSRAGFSVPLYNDQYDLPVVVLADFLPYSPELFDADPDNDDRRNLNSDGHITLTSSRPFRTLVALNRFDASREPEIDLASAGGVLSVRGAVMRAFTSDIRLASAGGAIQGERLDARAEAQAGQVRVVSSGGTVDLAQAVLAAPNGRIRVDAAGGPVFARSAAMTSRENLELAGGGGIDVVQASLNSTHADLLLDVLAPGRVVNVDQARFADRNNAAAVRPAGAVVVGTPAAGTTE